MHIFAIANNHLFSLLCLQTVSLHRTSDEYLEIETLFCNTMRGFDIVKIERIQNKALWEAFQLYVYDLRRFVFGI